MSDSKLTKKLKARLKLGFILLFVVIFLIIAVLTIKTINFLDWAMPGPELFG